MHCLCLGRQALPGGVSLLYAFIQNICSCHECNGSMSPQKEQNFVHTVYIYFVSLLESVLYLFVCEPSVRIHKRIHTACDVMGVLRSFAPFEPRS